MKEARELKNMANKRLKIDLDPTLTLKNVKTKSSGPDYYGSVD